MTSRSPSWRWLAPLPLMVGLSVAARAAHLPPAAPQDERPNQTLVRLLAAEESLSASPSDVFWLRVSRTAPRWGTHSGRAWVLASAPGELDDVYLVTTELSPEGGVIRITGAYNLTQTSAADESYLVADNDRAAFTAPVRTSAGGGRTYSVHLLDARKGALAPPGALSRREAWQRAVTLFQETGQTQGIGRRVFKLDPPAQAWWMTLQGDRLVAVADGERLEIPVVGEPEVGGHRVLETTTPPGRSGNLTTWAVDRVRGLPWFGDENMQRLKAVAYRALDYFDRHVEGGSPDEADQRALLEDLGDSPTENTSARTRTGADDPWPPPDLAPLLDPAFEGEGEWLSLERDAFVRHLPGAGSTFYTTFIRPDPERKFSRVTIALWDPRHVELHMEGGTEEPKSATGDHGTGLIPRDPELMKRLVGAFNGGFQGTHGDYGMHVAGVTYVPPRPYAATVAVLRDGTTAFGTWPNSPDIPADVDSFRQNLTALVADKQLNPFGRLWWGGVPQGWEDDTRTVRSGICLTERGHIAYFYGAKVDHKHLGKAMLATGCSYGVHLDMNQGHTGLEFYQVDSAEALPPLGMPPHPMWQAEGPVPEGPGLRFRGRRLFRSMQLMNFPRYIQRGERDFFYLTLRPSLPGAALHFPDALPGEGAWRADARADEEAPPLVAQTTVRPDPVGRASTKIHVLEIDASRLELRTSATSNAWLSLVPPEDTTGAETLWWLPAGVRIAPRRPAAGARALATGARAASVETRAAWGISVDNRTFFYGEVATAPEPAADAALLTAALRAAGANELLFLTHPSQLVRHGGLELSGHPAPVPPDALHLVRSQREFYSRIFPETVPLPRDAWKQLQEQGFGVPGSGPAETN